MTKSQLLFDSNTIYRLIRELPQDAVEKLVEGTTIYLAYYEARQCIVERMPSSQKDKY